MKEFGEINLVNSSYKIGEYIYNLTETIVNNYKKMVKKKIDYKNSEYYDKINTELSLQKMKKLVNDSLDEIYLKEISYALKAQNNCTSSQC